MRVLVTGATGFVGSNVARCLIEQGHHVSVLVRPTSDRTTLAGLSVTPIVGSLTDHQSLSHAVQDIEVLFHVAADYRFWVPDPQTMHEVNVEGTIRLLEAAVTAGVRKIVYTSSTVAVQCFHDRLGTEEGFVNPDETSSLYQRTKVLAERAVWRLIGQGAPITIVNPSTPIGPFDWRPTPTGRLIVDFLNGNLPAFLNAAFNFVYVGDVAKGHWLAADKGLVGERYILGGYNLSLSDFLGILAKVSGQAAPRVKIPYAVAYMAGAVGELTGRLTGQEPRASLDGVRMARLPMQFDSRKAVQELGLPQTPIEKAVEEAVQWFRQHGYITRGGRR